MLNDQTETRADKGQNLTQYLLSRLQREKDGKLFRMTIFWKE